ncbi:hypothetical protein [Epilithonimonas sp.]|uniref:hypothetical protein n=1 Tax=Epilithonimonas sp. TaxID=2894511 RepID=UPI00289719F6|nr:hypothetical protein [Epilithonimonas sp.]
MLDIVTDYKSATSGFAIRAFYFTVVNSRFAISNYRYAVSINENAKSTIRFAISNERYVISNNGITKSNT